MIGAALVQVPLSGGLVLGWFGLPQLGVAGAALSAVVLSGVTGVIMLLLLFQKRAAPILRRAGPAGTARL